MQDFDYTLTWYHGSQQKLNTLRIGSSITQNRNVAKGFSHSPSLLTQSEGDTVKHDGVTPGYLYTVADEIGPDDVRPHPHPVNVTRWEWLTNRELKLKLIEQTIVTDEERLTGQEIAEMKRKQEERGEQTFVEEDA